MTPNDARRILGMDMGQNNIVKGKFIKFEGIELDTNVDGGLHIRVGEQELDLTEKQALGLNELLDDVVEWNS